MRSWALTIAVALLPACASGPPPRPRPASTVRELPARVKPAREPRVMHPVFVQEGKASWYGREQQGGPTASGERFDMNSLTAAHRTLPMNTRVRVTNLTNGRSVVVRINDRGPYSHGRIIDVSLAAARALEMLDAGVVPARVEVVGR